MEIAPALRHFASSYVRDRRASGELRSRLVGIAHERSRITEGVAVPDAEARLAEVERVRATLERSSRAADERLRATEAVIAAVVREAGSARRTAKPAPSSVPAGAKPAAQRRSVPRDPVRGGWSAPPG